MKNTCVFVKLKDQSSKAEHRKTEHRRRNSQFHMEKKHLVLEYKYKVVRGSAAQRSIAYSAAHHKAAPLIIHL